jgi:hypothetical protein
MFRSIIRPLALVLLAAVAAPSALASEADALVISATIQERHVPHGTVIDPIFTTADGTVVDRYTRGGDSAIWTGHYLAAEALRYGVTKSPDALENARRALAGLKGLVNGPGNGVLARVRVPVAWEDTTDKRAIITEEAGHGVYQVSKKKGAYYWIGNTSRDQYVGVFFGLATAYDQIDESADPEFRKTVGWIATRLLDHLLANDWAVRMPDGRVSTVFTGRFDQQLMLLQVGRHVNPDRYAITYEKYRKKYATYVTVPIALEVQDEHDSYFKFNLDYATLYTLIRLEEPASRYLSRYTAAYATLRTATADHGNAHFNAIDRALRGPDAGRDFETRALLREWLVRPRRDTHVDLTGVYTACGPGRACEPIPVRLRVPTDFLWQRSPFQLEGGSDGRIEGAGIDYILPYWMSRLSGVPVD